ncbi:MAG: hypothetical protein ABL904_21305, partial [Hyphomicrobiaceae bacterium]
PRESTMIARRQHHACTLPPLYCCFFASFIESKACKLHDSTMLAGSLAVVGRAHPHREGTLAAFGLMLHGLRHIRIWLRD